MSRRLCPSLVGLAALAHGLLAACATTTPPGRARTWVALGDETRLVHTTSVVMLAPPLPTTETTRLKKHAPRPGVRKPMMEVRTGPVSETRPAMEVRPVPEGY
jgi:hypothetical protein